MHLACPHLAGPTHALDLPRCPAWGGGWGVGGEREDREEGKEAESVVIFEECF